MKIVKNRDRSLVRSESSPPLKSRTSPKLRLSMLPAWAKARVLKRPLVYGECRGRAFRVFLNGSPLMQSFAPSRELVQGSCLASVLLSCRLHGAVFGGVRQVY